MTCAVICAGGKRSTAPTFPRLGCDSCVSAHGSLNLSFYGWFQSGLCSFLRVRLNLVDNFTFLSIANTLLNTMRLSSSMLLVLAVFWAVVFVFSFLVGFMCV